MYKIEKHPILEIPSNNKVTFKFHDKTIECDERITIAAALHQAGFPVHSHSDKGRNRSLNCGIGKCSACEMIVDNQIKRICITKVDGIKEVKEIPKNYIPKINSEKPSDKNTPYKIYNTAVAIIGAGPAGLAAHKILNEYNIFPMLAELIKSRSATDHSPKKEVTIFPESEFQKSLKRRIIDKIKKEIF